MVSATSEFLAVDDAAVVGARFNGAIIPVFKSIWITWRWEPESVDWWGKP